MSKYVPGNDFGVWTGVPLARLPSVNKTGNRNHAQFPPAFTGRRKRGGLIPNRVRYVSPLYGFFMNDAWPLHADFLPDSPCLRPAFQNPASPHSDHDFAQLIDLVRCQSIRNVILGEIDPREQEFAQFPDSARVLNFGTGNDAVFASGTEGLAALLNAVDGGAKNENGGARLLGRDENVTIDGEGLAVADGDVDGGGWG